MTLGRTSQGIFAFVKGDDEHAETERLLAQLGADDVVQKVDISDMTPTGVSSEAIADQLLAMVGGERITYEELIASMAEGRESPMVARYARPDERADAGRRTNPAAAEVFFNYAQTLDPYGDDPDLPEEYWQVGREFFAADPADGIAVWWFDLPEETRQALEGKRRAANVEGWRRLTSVA